MGTDKGYLLNGMKMGRRNLKELRRLGKMMDYLLGGMIMDRRNQKEFTMIIN